MQSLQTKTRAQIEARPIRSTISAIGYGTVATVNTVVNTIDLVNDITIIAKHTLATSIIEAKEESMIAELESFDRIAKLKLQLEAKQSKGDMATA